MLTKQLTDKELLCLYAELMDELRSRGVVRSSNGPAADYAEGLVAKAFDLTLNGASTTGFDGVDPLGRRFEVKCRRLTPENESRQLSAIRGLEQKHFDVLVGVLFDRSFAVARAALIPYEIVKEIAVYVRSTNSWKLMLRDSVWATPGVQDVTESLRSAQHWESQSSA